jgi:hypothetical protein
VLRDDVGDAARERGLVGVLAPLAEQQQRLRRVVGAVVRHREQELQQPVLQSRERCATMPRSMSAIFPFTHEHVARMRIGVEQAVAQHLLEVRAEERVGEALAVELDARERAERRDLRARR